MSDELTPSADFFTDVRGILADARRAAYTAVNSAMVAAYWQIGRRIVEEEQGGTSKSTYGDQLLPELSRALTAEFGKGFSYANLRNFRQFYLTYPDPQICYALRSKLTWTHHRLIMRVDSPSAREYYITHSEQEDWSTRTLKRQIETRTYQRLLSSKTIPVSPPERLPAKPSSQWVIEAFFALSCQSTDDERPPLPVALDLAAQHDQLSRRHIPLAPRSGESVRDQVARHLAIESKQRESQNLSKRLAKEAQFSRKVEINQKLRLIRNELSQLVSL